MIVIWLWLWMTPIMTFVVGVPLEKEYLIDGKVPIVERFPEADAIVLLGGSMGVEPNLSPYAEMWTSADRVWQAARLYKAGKATKIVATGNGAVDSTLGLLRDFGVAEDDISFLDARNTEEEARGMAGKEYSKILLVTSAWHMKRAELMFKKYTPKIEVVCAPADFENLMRVMNGISLVPDVGVFAQNSVSFHEWIGYWGYRLLK